MLKRILFTGLMLLTLCSPLYAAERITLQNGAGAELGTTDNPLVVTFGGATFTWTASATGTFTLDAATTDHTSTPVVDFDVDFDTATATTDVLAWDIDVDRAATDTGGTRGMTIDLTTGAMANGEWSWCYGGLYTSAACTAATSNAAVLYAVGSTKDAQCNDYGVYIDNGFDYGIYDASGITSTATISGEQLTSTDDATITDALDVGGALTMGSADANAGIFYMKQGATASDPTFTITQTANDVAFAQTVGEMDLTAVGEVTINEASADVNFRVESNGNANALTVDGGYDALGLLGDPLAISGALDWVTGNVIYVPIGGSIEAYHDAATAGDTLVLASGTYTVTDDIDITKAINIVGQGVGKTIVTCATASKNMLHITSDNVTISNLSITGTAGNLNPIYIDGTAGSVFSNVNLYNLRIVTDGDSGYSYVYYKDAGGTVDNCEITLTGDTYADFWFTNESTAEAATALYVIDSRITTHFQASSMALYVLDNTASQDCIVYAYNSTFTAIEDGATSSRAVMVSNGDAIAYLYECILNATDYDISQDNTASVTLYNCDLVNGTTEGTITYDGTVVTEDLYVADDATIANGGTLQINSAGDDKNIQIAHDDTDGAMTVSAGDLTVTAADDIFLVATGDVVQVGKTNDDTQPNLQILADADSDAGGDMAETLTVTLTPAADPTAATWGFTSTQSAGYTFDKFVDLLANFQVHGQTDFGADDDAANILLHSGSTLTIYEASDDFSASMNCKDGAAEFVMNDDLNIGGASDAENFYVHNAGTVNVYEAGDNFSASAQCKDGAAEWLFNDDVNIGADDAGENLYIHSAGTFTMYDASDDTSVAFDVDDGTTELDLTGSLNVSADGIVANDLQVGSSVDDHQPLFKVVGDADSDAGGDTSDTLQVTLTPNADPTLAAWAFTSTQSAGYTFDKSATITGSATVTEKVTAQGAGGIEIGKDAATNVAGTIKLWGTGANDYSTIITAGTQTASATYDLPPAMATANSQALVGSTGGALSWSTNFGANDIATTGNLSVGGNVNGALFSTSMQHMEIADLLGTIVSPVTILGLTGTMADSDTEKGYESASGRTFTYNGTQVGDKTFQGSAYVFSPDANGYISTPDVADLTFALAACTWGGWIQIVDTATEDVLLSKWDETTAAEIREYKISKTTDEKIKVYLYDETNDGYSFRLTDAAVAVGWHYLVVTYDGAADAAGTIVYVDGALVASTATEDQGAEFASMRDTAAPLWIGAIESTAGAAANFWLSDIGRLFIDNAAMSAANIWKSYEETRGYYNK